MQSREDQTTKPDAHDGRLPAFLATAGSTGWRRPCGRRCCSGSSAAQRTHLRVPAAAAAAADVSVRVVRLHGEEARRLRSRRSADRPVGSTQAVRPHGRQRRAHWQPRRDGGTKRKAAATAVRAAVRPLWWLAAACRWLRSTGCRCCASSGSELCSTGEHLVGTRGPWSASSNRDADAGMAVPRLCTPTSDAADVTTHARCVAVWHRRVGGV